VRPLAVAFLGAAFLAAVFLTLVFLGAAFLAAVFLTLVFLGAAFLAAVFLTLVFLGAVLFAGMVRLPAADGSLPIYPIPIRHPHPRLNLVTRPLKSR